MPLWGILLTLFTGFILFALLHALSKNKRPFLRALISMLIGAGTLLGVNLLAPLTNVYIPVSLLSILVSVLGGVPGVTLILALNLFF